MSQQSPSHDNSGAAYADESRGVHPVGATLHPAQRIGHDEGQCRHAEDRAGAECGDIQDSLRQGLGGRRNYQQAR